MSEVFEGEVKFWRAERGFGFIKRDDGQKDVFLHVRDCAGRPSILPPIISKGRPAGPPAIPPPSPA